MVFPKELTGNIKAEALPFTLGCPQGDLACMGAFQTYKRGQLTIKIRLALMDTDQYTNHIEINCPNRSLHVHPQRVASTSSFITPTFLLAVVTYISRIFDFSTPLMSQALMGSTMLRLLFRIGIFQDIKVQSKTTVNRLDKYTIWIKLNQLLKEFDKI